MFELSREEYHEILRSQHATLEQGAYSKYLPFAFTEHGLLMLSNVLKSERAISMSIIDVFVKMREMLANHTELYLGIERIKNAITKQKGKTIRIKNIELIFQYLDELAEKKNITSTQSERKKIGYVLGNENQIKHKNAQVGRVCENSEAKVFDHFADISKMITTEERSNVLTESV